MSIVMINSRFIPFIIFILCVFNNVLNSLGFSYLYAYILVLSTACNLFPFSFKLTKKMLIIYVYIFSLVLVFLIQLLYYGSSAVFIRQFFIYTSFLLYWTIYFKKYSIEGFYDLLHRSVTIALVVALIAIMNYFLRSHAHWLAFLDHTNFHTFYASEYREQSIFTSPQVFGIFMALYFMFVFDTRGSQPFFRLFSLLVFLVGGLLSGDKAFMLSVVLFILFNSNFHSRVRGVFMKITSRVMMLLVFSVCIAIAVNHGLIAMAKRFSIISVVQQEKRVGRIDHYISVILGTNPIVGNGIGSEAFNLDKSQRFTAESYFIKLYNEAGIIPLTLLLALLFSSLSFPSLHLQYFHNRRLILLIIYLSMIYVASIESPVFFIFWGFICTSFVSAERSYLLFPHIEKPVMAQYIKSVTE